jgi:hypothetical protein
MNLYEVHPTPLTGEGRGERVKEGEYNRIKVVDIPPLNPLPHEKGKKDFFTNSSIVYT